MDERLTVLYKTNDIEKLNKMSKEYKTKGIIDGVLCVLCGAIYVTGNCLTINGVTETVRETISAVSTIIGLFGGAITATRLGQNIASVQSVKERIGELRRG